MDLSKLDLGKEESTMTLIYPMGHPKAGEEIIDEASGKPASITLLSMDSRRFRQREKEIGRRHLKNRGRNLNVEDLNLDKLVAATTKWSGIVVDGEELECSDENAFKLYDRFRFIRDDALAWLSDRSNYSGN